MKSSCAFVRRKKSHPSIMPGSIYITYNYCLVWIASLIYKSSDAYFTLCSIWPLGSRTPLAGYSRTGKGIAFTSFLLMKLCDASLSSNTSILSPPIVTGINIIPFSFFFLLFFMLENLLRSRCVVIKTWLSWDRDGYPCCTFFYSSSPVASSLCN